MDKKGISITSIFALLLLAGVFAIADSNNSTNSAAVNWADRCSKINEVVSQRIQKFDSGNVRRINSYNNTESMIQKLINQLDSKGANITLAKVNFQELQNYVNQFNSDYSVFIAKLKSLQNFTCGNSSGDFVNELKDAKTMLPTLRNDSIQIREMVMRIKLNLMQARGDLVQTKLGERINSIQDNMQRRISNLNNRTTQIQNRLNKFGNKTR